MSYGCMVHTNIVAAGYNLEVYLNCGLITEIFLYMTQVEYSTENFHQTNNGADRALSLHNLTCFTAGGLKIVVELSFSLDFGDSLLVTGPNGCGKSTLLITMMKLKSGLNDNLDMLVFGDMMMLPQV